MTYQDIYQKLKNVNPAKGDTVIFTTSEKAVGDLYKQIKSVLDTYNISSINVLIYQNI